MGDLTLDPATAAAFARRAGSSSAVTLDRSGSAGSTYVAGRVIVKFRDGTSTAARINSLSLVSAAGAVSERPSYANFDLVRIDPNDDAEAVADALRQRPDVEYAQAAYRVHTEDGAERSVLRGSSGICPCSIWSARGTSRARPARR